ncbi:MAG: DUF362 domain-containing protein [Chloroflexota bacterium]
MSVPPQPKVRATYCPYQADEEEIYTALKRATDPLDEAWEKLRRAKTIGLKFNQDWPEGQCIYFEGQLQQLVGEKFARATLRLLRERTDAELLHFDASAFDAPNMNEDAGMTTTFKPIFEEYGVEHVDGNKPPFKAYQVPGGGQMFRQYLMSERAVDTDAFVSVQRMKNHLFTGITLCLKNLFGLMPMEPYGRARQYYHHLVRMPYMLADMGQIFKPTLNILDALISQAGREWGNGVEGPPRITNTIIAGDQTIATDAIGAHLMGHDPTADWLTPPFHRDRNALLVATENGYGTVQLSDIDFESEVEAPLGEFFSDVTDPRDMVMSWRCTTAEQALYYFENQKKFIDQYAGQYILLQEREVRWHDTDSNLNVSRRKLSGSSPEQAMWFKYVDPDEVEGEFVSVYEHVLKTMPQKI